MMKSFQRICIVCPAGCHLDITDYGSTVNVSGNRCPRGKAYAVNEMRSPKRTLTFTVKTVSADLPYLPVKSSAPLPTALIPEAITALRKITVDKPVKCGDVLIENFSNSGADIIFTRGNSADSKL